jgi:hypothetical protein
MTQVQRCFLSARLVADGITEHGLLLKFLPLFLTNVSKNSCLDLVQGFRVLVEAIDTFEDYVRQLGIELSGTTVVDVSEMAKMAKKVRTSRSFQESISALLIGAGAEGNRRVFRIYYSEHFWKVLSSKPASGERSLIERLYAGFDSFPRRNSTGSVSGRRDSISSSRRGSLRGRLKL